MGQVVKIWLTTREI